MFEQFNVNMEQYQSDLAEINNKQQENNDKPKEYKKIEDGQHEMTIRSLELGTNRAGDKLMLKGSFKMNEKGYELLWVNNVLTGTKNDSFMIKKSVDFLNSLGATMTVEYTGSFDDLAKQIEIVFADVRNCTFVVNVQTQDNGFKNIDVVDVFE